MLNDDLDRSHAVTYRDQSRNSLKHLLTELNLEDAWRLHNPDEQMFTHHSHLGSASRIDRIYTPRNLRNSVLNTEITPCAHSDHDIVSAFLTFGETPRGKGVWHLNCDILHNNEFRRSVGLFGRHGANEKIISFPHSGGMRGNKKLNFLQKAFLNETRRSQ